MTTNTRDVVERLRRNSSDKTKPLMQRDGERAAEIIDSLRTSLDAAIRERDEARASVTQCAHDGRHCWEAERDTLRTALEAAKLHLQRSVIRCSVDPVHISRSDFASVVADMNAALAGATPQPPVAPATHVHHFVSTGTVRQSKNDPSLIAESECECGAEICWPPKEAR